MATQIQIGRTNDDPRKISKTFTGTTITCYVKEPCDILNPIFILAYSSNYETCNYCKAFDRSYFIDSIVGTPGEKMELHCHEDVLDTYKTQILAESAVVERTSDWDNKNLYLTDPEVKPYQYTRTWTRVFPNVFSPNYSNFFLITIG